MKTFKNLFYVSLFIVTAACSPEPKFEENQQDLVQSIQIEERAAAPQNAIPGEYLVLLKKQPNVEMSFNRSSADIELEKQVYTEKSVQILESINKNSAALVEVYQGAVYGFLGKGLSEIDIERLKKREDVSSVEPNYIFQMDKVALEEEAQFDENIASNERPYEIISSQINFIGFRDMTHRPGRCFIIGTGITRHEDLNVDRILSHSVYPEAHWSKDIYSSGTRAAGVIAAKYNGIGTVGVAAGAKVIGVKVYKETNGNGTTTTSKIVSGVVYTYNNAQSGDVFYFAPSHPLYYSTYLNNAFRFLGNKIPGAISAGQYHGNTNTISPAAVQTSRTWITGIGNWDTTAAFSSSNYGSNIDCWASFASRTTTAKNKYITLASSTNPAAYVAGILLARGNNSIGANGSISYYGYTAPKAVLD